MSTLCKNHFLQQLYRKIDGELFWVWQKSSLLTKRLFFIPSGAVLWSQNERNLDCVVTFQTHSILQRFMLRFDMLQLDCNDHLYIYDGSHAVGTHKVSTRDFSLLPTHVPGTDYMWTSTNSIIYYFPCHSFVAQGPHSTGGL